MDFFEKLGFVISDFFSKNKRALGWDLLVALICVCLYTLTPGTTWAINYSFIAVMSWMFVHDVINKTYCQSWYPTLGMLGTFIGILVGLLGFDTNAENLNIGNLLDGLKLAFITSIAGVTFSIIRSFLSAIGIFPIEEPTEVEQLEEMNVNFEKFFKKLGKSFGAQLQDGLAEALNNLTDNISASFTKSIDDFTAAVNGLTAQTENLQNLYSNFENTMNTMQETTHEVSGLLTNVRDAVTELDKPLAVISSMAEHANTTVKALNDTVSAMKQVNTLSKDTVNSISDMTKTYTDETHKFFDKVTKNQEEELASAGSLMTGIVNKLTENFTQVNKAFDEAAKTLPDAVTKLSKHVDDAVAKAVSGKKGK